MSAIRLYVDEDAEQNALVAGLRSHEFDIVTAMEADMIGRTDREQLEYACQHERTIYSLNAADFARLHAEYLQAAQPHFGIVLIPQTALFRWRENPAIGGTHPHEIRRRDAKPDRFPVKLRQRNTTLVDG